MWRELFKVNYTLINKNHFYNSLEPFFIHSQSDIIKYYIQIISIKKSLIIIKTISIYLSIYHNSSVRLNMLDTSSWDQNLPNFIYIYIYIYIYMIDLYNICICRHWNVFALEHVRILFFLHRESLHTHISQNSYICIYIYIYIYIYILYWIHYMTK